MRGKQPAAIREVEHVPTSPKKCGSLERAGEAEAGGLGSGELTGLGAMPPSAVLARSEFLLPLDDDTIELYNSALR